MSGEPSALVAVRLARPLDSYPPLPYRGEVARAVIRCEPCACGESIPQYAGDDIPTTVRRHYLGVAHLLYEAQR